MALKALRKWLVNLLDPDDEASSADDSGETKPPFEETLLRLQQLISERSFVDVTFPERSRASFQSLLLKVDAEERYVLIDELFPSRHVGMIESGDIVEVTSRAKGMPMKFRTLVEAIQLDTSDGMPSYRLALPGAVEAAQRRGTYRVPLGRDSGVRLRIMNPDGSTELGTVLNLSRGGLGFSCQGNISDRLRENNHLGGCKLSLPDGEVMTIDVDVRSFEFKRYPYRHTVIGSRIRSISSGDEKALDRFMIAQQRLLRRELREESD